MTEQNDYSKKSEQTEADIKENDQYRFCVRCKTGPKLLRLSCLHSYCENCVKAESSFSCANCHVVNRVEDVEELLQDEKSKQTETSNHGNDQKKHCVRCQKTDEKLIKLNCTHFYCGTCFGVETKQVCCLKCHTLNMVKDIKEDRLVEKLKSLESSEKSRLDKGKNECEFCEKKFCVGCMRDELTDEVGKEMCQECVKSKKEGNEEKVEFFCLQCKQVICYHCKELHLKNPFTKGHKFASELVETDVLDEKIPCAKKHNKEAYCRRCNEFLCVTCDKNHDTSHPIAASKDTLRIFEKKMNGYRQNIATKLEINAINEGNVGTEIARVKIAHLDFKEESKVRFEHLIERLKSTKVKIEEDVAEEFMKSKQRLEMVRSRIQDQAERCKIVLAVADELKSKSASESKLQELQSALFQQASLVSKEDIIDKLPITTPDNFDDFCNRTDEEVEAFLWNPQFTTETKFLRGLECLCDRFQDYFQNAFQKGFETIGINEWCNRVSIVEGSLYLGFCEWNKIVRFCKESGYVKKELDAGRQPIVVKQMNNGDIIAAGLQGLFITDKDFKHWELLRKGKFCDISFYGRNFTALEYQKCQLVTFTCHRKGNNYEWNLVDVFEMKKNEKVHIEGNANSTFAVDSNRNIIVCSHNKIIVYRETGVSLKELPFTDCMITGNDNAGNVMICNYHTGALYGLNTTQAIIGQYNMMKHHLYDTHIEGVCDLVVDQAGHMWVLHEKDKKFSLTEFIPLPLSRKH